MEENEYGDYADDLLIEQYELDVEWLKQPMYFMKWSEVAENAISERDQAREEMTIEVAKLELAMRANPEKYGIDKVTDKSIDAAIKASEKYSKLSSQFQEKAKKAKILSAARDAFEHRKTALSKLTDLFLSNYFSQPAEEKISYESEAISGFKSRRILGDSINEWLERRKND